MSSPKTILFLGATGGVGLSTLRRSLAANHTCVALCRTPSKLSAEFPNNNPPANLHLVQGDALDADVLARCLLVGPAPSSDRRLVDTIIFSIGGRPTLRGMSDPHVCENGMAALLRALREVMTTKSATTTKPKPPPRLVAVSTTGITDQARDIPLPMVPLYKGLLHTPHKDKKAMERLVMDAGVETVAWTLIRGSLYTNGPATEGLVREGMEDPVTGVVTSTAVGYTISREDVGKWVFENCVEGGTKWVGKAAVLSY
ncbi:oxidoreductase AflX [Chaetomidium leptoderma]|uniref:Oxidoreductase AflX n=1 Tax=Chaetomidium leptoderma TaxID=669021 RepID=A0AAN6VIC4_9PEZI|nr:oxidoreductase AflX [Chaetomidium leptoderma]